MLFLSAPKPGGNQAVVGFIFSGAFGAAAFERGASVRPTIANAEMRMRVVVDGICMVLSFGSRTRRVDVFNIQV
jgi:hypothetical protein